MNLTFDMEHDAFRSEVRSFFERDYPRDIIEKVRAGHVATRDDHVRSQQALQSRGWLAVSWPKENGGTGWDAVHRYIFEEERERAGALNLVPMAVLYVGPVICHFGTEAQKARWLPDILESRAMWNQGYSEPESGSDLASLKMTAESDGDQYILNGTKVWTTYGQWGDWIFCLARTSKEERKQDGISFICAKMDSPGISVRPIITMDGLHVLNQIEFDNVRVPVDQRIGEEGKGWFYSNYLLKHERLSYAHVAQKRHEMATLRGLAANMPADAGGTMIDDAPFASRVAECEAAIDVLEISVLRALLAGDAAGPAQVSTIKISATELAQQITELYIDLAGPSAGVFPDRDTQDWPSAAPLAPRFVAPAMVRYLYDRAQTIYGGSTEVQKTIVWRGLAL